MLRRILGHLLTTFQSTIIEQTIVHSSRRTNRAFLPAFH
ncbi:hypothetical protein ATORI0001_1499 [Lancefieldella rimae ATCC 49626]|uniref:Uncharacterized protein n=1 Tax=Lancefieldella rimae (strain ATCC 49626 / DSM 7090 / CCUG 31168 / NBRC 15546 / VPI D140H-11A) TaxID=553184 RepID=B9CMF9_LANR4|nr:hypothetical protein ATORI0001_1499 [Lancefieldella rimae ATCC 49626]